MYAADVFFSIVYEIVRCVSKCCVCTLPVKTLNKSVNKRVPRLCPVPGADQFTAHSVEIG